MFSDKLDFIITLTNTPNKEIAQAANVDASHISRLRSGARRLPKKPKFLIPMSEYFVKRITTDEQRKLFADTLKLEGGYPSQPDEAAKILAEWFLDDSSNTNSYIEAFLKNFGKKQEDQANMSGTYAINSFVPTYSNYYFGIQGKKNAMMRLFKEVIFHPNPVTLYIFSDEMINWISEDDMYASAWIDALSAISETGKNIVVVHSMRKNLNAMLKSISRWVPLYLTGKLKPYYLPISMKGSLRRTLFVAPEVAAVISNSVGDKEEGMLNIYIRDKQAVSALHLEFMNLISLCKPVMKAYTQKDIVDFSKKLCEFDAVSADSIMNPRYLSLATLPKDVQNSVCERINQPLLLPVLQMRTKAFEANISRYSVTEIINLPDPEHVKNGKVKIAMLDLLGAGYVYYSKDEFISHLNHIIHLIKTHENYHAIINNGNINGEYLMHIKKDTELLFIKTSPPSSALLINEIKIIQTFWEFMLRQTTRVCKNTNKNEIILGYRPILNFLTKFYIKAHGKSHLLRL